RARKRTSSDSEAAQMSEAVKRLALEISRRDAQIEKLERSLLSLGGNDATFTERGRAGAGDPTTAEAGTNPASPAAAAAAAATAPGGAAVASPRASSSDGGNVAEGGAGVLPSREELDQLTKENRSLREALTAMAVKSGAGDAHATAGDGSGKPTPVDGGAEEAGAKEQRAVEGNEASSKLQQEAADKRVEQLTRVNETIMRQLQTLMARKDSPREVVRRASRAVGGGRAASAAAAGGDKDKDKSEPAAAVQADMQRLIAEMGDLRQLVAGGFANKNTAKAARHLETVPSHPHGVSGDGDGGGVVPSDFPARATTGASRGEAAAGKEVRGMNEDGTTLEEAEGGGSGGSIPAPAIGSAEEFSEKPQQQGGPKTAQGQEALRWRLRRLNLPPEEWAEDVRNINAQLVEALEQLREREAELDEHEELIVRYESHLSDMRAQVAALYRDHADREKEFDEKQKASKAEAGVLREERDALAVRARRLQEVLDVEDEAADDPTAPHRALRDLSRKVTVLEVNEAVMARRFASVKEQLQVEAEARAASERDFLEMSTAGKTRVLYLEQWKAGASARLLRLQQRLDVSVPEQDLVCTRRELEQLQEEFLGLLHSSAESTVEVTKLRGLPERVRQLEEELCSARTSLAAAEETSQQANLRLAKADARAEEASAQVAAVAGGATQADFSGLLAEVAKHQGECAKAEVERSAAARRAEMAERRVASLDAECRAVKERALSLEAREREARQNAQAAAAELIKVQNRFEGGLTSEQARSLEEKLEAELVRGEALALEADRHKEIADIASEQTLALNHQVRESRGSGTV
ncbi:unnamed protein product, partial [Ectocarpus sp. 12 AP-2014]